MPQQSIHLASRRRLLQFLAASPLLAHTALAQGLRPSDPVDWAPRELDKLIENPARALDVFDFEPVMKKNVPPAHFGYMATGVDDEMALRANREGFRKFALIPRRLVDVSKISMSADILGATYDSPIVIARRAAIEPFIPMVKSPLPGRPRPATICKSCPQWRQRRLRTPSPREGLQSGFSSIPPSALKLRKR